MFLGFEGTKIEKDTSLSYCDKSSITQLIQYSDRPHCPASINTEIHPKNVDVMIFKPNIKAEVQPAVKCKIRVAWQLAEKTLFGAHVFHESGVFTHSVEVEECKKWNKTRKCNLNEYKNKYAAVSSSVMVPVDKFTAKFSFMNKPVTYNTYSTKNVIEVSPPYALRVKNFTSVNCIAEETYVKSSGNYKTIFAGNSILYNAYNESVPGSPLMIGSSREAHATYIWNKPSETKLCSYILHEVHKNTGKLISLNKEFSHLPMEEKPFNIILPHAMKILYLKPDDELITLDSIDNSYCISSRIQDFPSVQIYKTALGSIVAIYPHEDEDKVDAHVNSSKAITRNLKLSIPDELNSRRQKRDAATKASRSHLLLESEEIMSKVRYYIYKQTSWINTYKAYLFDYVCHNEQRAYDYGKALSDLHPSVVLSALLEKRVKAVKLGDLFGLIKCAKLEASDYELEPSLKYQGKCYSHPLIKFKFKGKRVIGQVKENEVFYPAIFTEECKLDATHHFQILGTRMTFEKYILNEKIDYLRDLDVKVIDIHRNDGETGFPDFGFQLDSISPIYSVTEEESASNFEDFINSNARSRGVDNKLRENELNVHINVDHLHDLADVGLAIGSFAGGLAGGISGALQLAAGHLTKFLGGILQTPIGKLLMFIFGTMAFIGGMFSFLKLIFLIISLSLQYYGRRPFALGGLFNRNTGKTYISLPNTESSTQESDKLISFGKTSNKL